MQNKSTIGNKLIAKKSKNKLSINTEKSSTKDKIIKQNEKPQLVANIQDNRRDDNTQYSNDERSQKLPYTISFFADEKQLLDADDMLIGNFTINEFAIDDALILVADLNKRQTIREWIKENKEIKTKKELTDFINNASNVYEHINDFPTFADIINGNIPASEKLLLSEKMSILTNMPKKCSSHYFEVRNNILETVKKYKTETHSINITQLDEKEKILIKKEMPIKYEILLADVSDRNKLILLEKCNELYGSYSSNNKLLQWIKWGLCISNKYIDLPVSYKDPQSKISQFLHEAKNTLDMNLFGMIPVKERLLELIAMRITNPTSCDMSIGLHGPAGVGKCLDPNTQILIYNGGYKYAKNIIAGDILLGDDNTPRIVQSVCEGVDNMYSVESEYLNDKFVCNQCHILTVYDIRTHEIVDIPLEKFINTPGSNLCDVGLSISANYIDTSNYRLIYAYPTYEYKPVDYELCVNLAKKSIIPTEFLYNSRNEMRKLYEIFIKSAPKLSIDDGGDIMIANGNNKKLRFLLKCLGYMFHIQGKHLQIHNAHSIPTCDTHIISKFNIRRVGFGVYNGFCISGNGRFVLENCIITHNTHLAQAFADAIRIPFTKINMGGSSDPHYFLGHSYTYEGSAPGIFVKALKQLKCCNGVIYFDEFDKINNINKVSNLFLHVSDPIQQNDFQDEYLTELKIDLSKMTFIYSFNDKSQINPILINRIPIISIPPYSTADKYQICIKHIIPSALKNINLSSMDVSFATDAIEWIINRIQKEDKNGIRKIKQLIQEIINKINICRYMNNTNNENSNSSCGSSGESNILIQSGSLLSYYMSITFPIIITIDIIKKLIDTSIPDDIHLSMYM